MNVDQVLGVFVLSIGSILPIASLMLAVAVVFHLASNYYRMIQGDRPPKLDHLPHPSFWERLTTGLAIMYYAAKSKRRNRKSKGRHDRNS